MRAFAVIALGGLASWAAFGQQAAPAPQFEVASIKAAAPQEMGRISVRMGGDAGRVDYTNVSLKNVLMRAYNVRTFQITGPSWLDSDRFDIVAKIPEGVSRDQVPVMLQNLLKERFKIEVHRETKEQSVYALVVGKDGPKLKKSEDAPDAPPPGGPGGPQVALSPRPAGEGGTTTGGPGGAAGGPKVAVAAGASGGGMAGGHAGPMQIPKGAMMMMNNGTTSRLETRGATLTAFCDMLSNLLDRPVVNRTGLEGNYDITLEVGMDDLMGMRRRMAAEGVGSPPIGHASPDGAPMPAPETAPGASIFTAVQQLGLKLEGSKAPIEYIVVDKAEKVPTEN